MINFSQWLNDILGNNKLLRDIRTGVAITAALLLALIYWGFIQNFNWSGLQLTRIVGLTIIFTLSVFIVRIEFKSRGFQTEMDENDNLKEIELILQNEDVNIIHDDLGIEWVADFNRRGQEKANRIKTEKRTNYLMERKRNRLRNNMSITKIEKELDRLKNEYLVDTKYKPIRYPDLISKQGFTKNDKEVLDRDMIYYNPVKQGNVTGFFTTFLKSIIPGSLGIGFLLNEPFTTIVLYYIFLLIAFAWTISTQYILVRRQTATRYLETRKNKLTLLREMKEYINKTLTQTTSSETV